MDFIWALALSTHIGLNNDYNEFHPHVRFYEDSVIAGAYYNSVDHLSFYGGYRLEPTERVGIEFAVTTGYPAFGPIAPQIRTTYDFNDNIRLFASPTGENLAEFNPGFILGIEFIIK